MLTNFLSGFNNGARCFISNVRQLFMVTSWDIKPDIWKLGEYFIDKYKECIPRMKKRSSLKAIEHHECLYAIFSHASYRHLSDLPIKRINEFTLVPDLSDEHSVVFTNKDVLGVVTRIIVSFRGTMVSNVKDLITDAFLTIGKEQETDRFRLADEKINLLINNHPLIPIDVCGHSMGGTQAIYISKKYNLDCYVYNPAQGISELYRQDIDKYPRIRVFRIVNDPVSCIAGLENIKGITLFPPVSQLSMIKNHKLENFLPKGVFEKDEIDH